MKIAVIGEEAFIKAFELIGAKGFKATNEEQVNEIITKILESGEYGMIILPERFLETTKDIRDRRYKRGEIKPIFAFLPDYTGITGKRIEELQKLISLAVGIQMKFD